MSSDKPAPAALPVGPIVDGAFPCPVPPHKSLFGRFGQLVPLTEAHSDDLFSAFSADAAGNGWTYLPDEPWLDQNAARDWCQRKQSSLDPQFYTIQDATGRALGFCSYLRIDPTSGCIEVGYIHFSPLMQKQPVATEVMYLMMRNAFNLGYRRYEWKCDALNAASKAAALRLGFTYEGTFRQATMYKGRNRDTAWFSVIDSEWPALAERFERWLSRDNFDTDGSQRRSLATV